MNYITVTQPAAAKAEPAREYQELTDFYRIPRYVTDLMLIDEEKLKAFTYLGQTATNQVIIARYQPVVLNNVQMLETQIELQNDNGIEKPQVLCKICHRGIPTQASYSVSSLLAVTFMYQEADQLKYEVILMFPEQFNHKFDCQATKNSSFYQFPPLPLPTQAHILTRQQEQVVRASQKTLKLNRNDIGQLSEQSERLIIMTANQKVTEYSVSYSFCRINAEFNNSQDKALLLQLNKLFSLSMRSIQSFGSIEECKAVAKIVDTQEFMQRICYLQFDILSGDLVVLTRETTTKKGEMYCKILLFKLSDEAEKNESLKMLEQFNTTYLPLEGYDFQYFEGLNVTTNAVRVEYHALSSLNNVLTFEFFDQKDGKLNLIACHLQTGSIEKISMPNSLFYKNKKVNPCFDELEMANLVVEFLINMKLIQNEERDEYFKMYKYLYSRQIIQKLQPQLLFFSNCFIWLVPNYNTDRMIICLIKALPYSPLEKLLEVDVPLSEEHLVHRLQSFIDESPEKEVPETEFYDTILDEPPSLDISININKPQLVSLNSSIDIIGLPSESQITVEERTAFNCSEQTDDIFESLADELSQVSCSEPESLISSQVTTTNCKLVLELFNNKNTIPLFTNNEICEFIIEDSLFKDEQTLFSSGNIEFYKANKQQLLEQSNNIFYFIEFFKAIKEEALETFEYLSSPYKEISMFAVNEILFTEKLFDINKQCIQYINFHPRFLLSSLYSKIQDSQDAKYQQYLCQLIIFENEIIQETVQLYKMQFGELVNLIKLLFDEDLSNIVYEYYDNKELNIQQLILNYFVRCFSSQQCMQTFEVSSAILYAIVQLAITLKRIMLQQIDRAGDIQPLELEFYIAQYFCQEMMLKRLICRYRTPKIYKLTQLPVQVDWSTNYHVIAKEYCYNENFVQTALRAIGDDDILFYQALQLKSEEEVQKLSQNFNDNLYFRVFDKNFNHIVKIISELADVNNKKQYKDAFEESTVFSNGAAIYCKIGKITASMFLFEKAILQKEELYEEFINNNCFRLQLATVSELIEAALVRQSYEYILSSNQYIDVQKDINLLPQWLQNYALQEYDDIDIPEQSQFEFVDPEQSYVANYTLLYNKSTIIQPLEFMLLSNEQENTHRKMPPNSTRLRVNSQLRQSPNILVENAIDNMSSIEQQIQSELFTYSLFYELQLLEQYSLVTSLLKTDIISSNYYQKVTEHLCAPYCQQQIIKVADSFNTVQLPISPFAKERILSYFQKQDIFEFTRGGNAVSKDDYYQNLTSYDAESQFKSLHGVTLYLDDFQQKRKVGAFLKNQFEKDFKDVIYEVLDDRWE